MLMGLWHMEVSEADEKHTGGDGFSGANQSTSSQGFWQWSNRLPSDGQFNTSFTAGQRTRKLLSSGLISSSSEGKKENKFTSDANFMWIEDTQHTKSCTSFAGRWQCPASGRTKTRVSRSSRVYQHVLFPVEIYM